MSFKYAFLDSLLLLYFQHMPEKPLLWISLVIVSAGLICIGKWVKAEYLWMASFGMIVIVLSLVFAQI